MWRQNSSVQYSVNEENSEGEGENDEQEEQYESESDEESEYEGDSVNYSGLAPQGEESYEQITRIVQYGAPQTQGHAASEVNLRCVMQGEHGKGGPGPEGAKGQPGYAGAVGRPGTFGLAGFAGEVPEPGASWATQGSQATPDDQFEDAIQEVEIDSNYKVDAIVVQEIRRVPALEGKDVKKKRRTKKSSENATKPPKVKKPRIRKKKIEDGESAICEICGHLAKSRTAMYYHHFYVHNRNDKYLCTYCGKGFCQAQALKHHTRIHTGEKPFTCEICGKGFTQRGTLRLHQRVHTGQKDFQCDICERSFSIKTSLTRHKLRAHVPKPILRFPCLECKRVFRQAGFLKTHQKLVHQLGVSPTLLPIIPEVDSSENQNGITQNMAFQIPQKTYSCDLCPAVFPMQKLLYQHDRTVHAHFRPYACFKCPQRFAEPAAAKAHFLDAHGITVYPLGSKELGNQSNNCSEEPESETDSEDGEENGGKRKKTKSKKRNKTKMGEQIVQEETIGNNIETTTEPPPPVRPKLRILIIRKKMSTTSPESCFSNLITLANVSSCSPTTASNQGTDDCETLSILPGKPNSVLDTITIDED